MYKILKTPIKIKKKVGRWGGDGGSFPRCQWLKEA
jgi:hypothetical protein